MLVYGDRLERVDPATLLSALAGELLDVAEAPPRLAHPGRLLASL